MFLSSSFYQFGLIYFVLSIWFDSFDLINVLWPRDGLMKLTNLIRKLDPIKCSYQLGLINLVLSTWTDKLNLANYICLIWFGLPGGDKLDAVNLILSSWWNWFGWSDQLNLNNFFSSGKFDQLDMINFILIWTTWSHHLCMFKRGLSPW